MSDLIERLKGPFKYHDNMLCVPESLIEDCGRALTAPLPDDVQKAANKLRNYCGATPAEQREIAAMLERLAQDNANLVSINAAHRLREDELEVKIEELTAQPAVVQLAALMQSLEIPPSAATLPPEHLAMIGAAIMRQAKAALQEDKE